MKNQFQFTPEISKEAIETWYRNRLGIVHILLPLLMVLSILLMIASPSIISLLACVVSAITITLYYVKKRILVKNELSRLDVLYRDEYPMVTVELKDEIEFKSGNSEKIIQYSDIKKIVVSKNIIVLILKGEMTIPLLKNAFISGSLEECLSLLKEYTK